MRYFCTLEKNQDNSYTIYDGLRGLKYTFIPFKSFNKSNLKDVFDVCSRANIEKHITSFANIKN